MLQYAIYSPSPSNKTAQQNLQHCTKLRKESTQRNAKCVAL